MILSDHSVARVGGELLVMSGEQVSVFDDVYRDRVVEIVRGLAAAGEPFSANEVRALAPEGPNIFGNVFKVLAREGVISVVPGVFARASKGRKITVWVGTEFADIVPDVPVVEREEPVVPVVVSVPKGQFDLVRPVRVPSEDDMNLVMPPVPAVSHGEAAESPPPSTDVLDVGSVVVAAPSPVSDTDIPVSALSAGLAEVADVTAAAQGPASGQESIAAVIERMITDEATARAAVLVATAVPVHEVDPAREKTIVLQQRELNRLTDVVDQLRDDVRSNSATFDQRYSVLWGRQQQAHNILRSWLARPKAGREVPRDQVNALVAALVNALGVPLQKRVG